MQCKRFLSLTLRFLVTAGLIVYILSAWVDWNDHVVLKDGSKVYGDIVSYAPTEVRIQTLQGQERLLTSEQLAYNQDSKQPQIYWGFLKIWRQLHVPWFLFFTGFFFFNMILATYRIKWLLDSQNITQSWGNLCKINFIGYFFNNFLPSDTGGDLVRAYYLARDTDQKAAAVIAVLIDRIVGLTALILLAGTVALFHIRKPEFMAAALVILAGCGGLACGLLLIFALPERLYAGKQGFVYTVLQAFCRYRHHLKPLLYTVSISFFIHIITIIGIIGFAYALGIRNVPWYAFFIYIPVGFLVMALPISLAGWGVGEATFSWLFSLVGVPMQQGLILSLLMRVAQIEISCVGATLWLMGRKKLSPGKKVAP